MCHLFVLVFAFISAHISVAEVTVGFSAWSAIEPGCYSTGRLAAVPGKPAGRQWSLCLRTQSELSVAVCFVPSTVLAKINAVLISTWILKPVLSQLQVMVFFVIFHASWKKPHDLQISLFHPSKPHSSPSLFFPSCLFCRLYWESCTIMNNFIFKWFTEHDLFCTYWNMM